MSEFLFMLTHHDSTVTNCLAVYDQVRDLDDLRWVGFKDVGVPIATLKELTTRIRSDGRNVVLEVVSIDQESEVRSINAGVEVGVDMLMGGTRPEKAVPILDGSGIRYFPFPGRIVGHPSILEGTIGKIAASAAALTSMKGVHGLDLLAYRFAGDVPALIAACVGAAHGPIVAAGSIESRNRIDTVTRLGCWAFTVGGAVFEGRFPAELDVRSQVTSILEMARSAEAAVPPLA
jgi:hypothetical protein